MPTSTTVNDLKINKLTSAQYDAAVQGGVIGENELSIITDLDEAIQVSSLPTAGASELGKIYQYIGATDSTYTNAYFYKCVSDGQSPATYSWTQVNVQPAPSGLPDQTGQSGKFLTTDGTDASWSDKPLVNKATGANALSAGINTSSTKEYSISYGVSASATGDSSIAIGTLNGGFPGGATASGWGSIAIGTSCVSSTSGAIAIGGSLNVSGRSSLCLGWFGNVTGHHSVLVSTGETETSTYAENDSFGFHNSNGTYTIIGADGTIPTDRFTSTPAAAGTYSATITVDGQGAITRSWATASDPLPSQTGNAGKVLATDGTTAYWKDISTSPSTMPQLLAANWSSNTQTVSVTGVTANNVVMVSPSPVSATEYAQCGILCTGQAAGTLTFTCTSVPTNDLTVNVVCF